MDYLLFYSQYSPSSKKILEQFPNIINKAVSVDSSQMKKHLKKLSIVCVPTLIIFSEGKILERIAGYAKIYNWILVTLYRIDQIQPQDEPQQPQVQQPQQPQPQMSQTQMSQSQIPQPQLSQTQTVTQLPQQVQQVEDVIIEDDLMIQGKTSLDDLVLEDIPEREEPTRPSSNSGSTMQLAEALKKERDNLDPKSKKKFVTDRGGS